MRYLGKRRSLLIRWPGRGFLEETALSWPLKKSSQPFHPVAQTENGISWLAHWDKWVRRPLDGSTGQEGFQWPQPHLVATQKVKVKSFSCVRLFATPWTAAHQAPLSMGFSRQEYRSGLPFPSPGDLPDPGFEPRSPTWQADALTSEPQGLQLRAKGN